MRLNRIQILFLSILLLLLFFNFYNQFPFILRCYHLVKSHQIQSIGESFIPLRPYVKHIQRAGYMNCRYSSHPLTDVSIMGPYQEAQFILSPLMLDYFHAKNYRYIILQCPDDLMQRNIKDQLSAKTLFATPEGIVLLDRGER